MKGPTLPIDKQKYSIKTLIRLINSDIYSERPYWYVQESFKKGDYPDTKYQTEMHSPRPTIIHLNNSG